MFSNPPNLADRFRSLLEEVKGALGERRRGLLGGPLALLMWIRTRRERKEAEAALEQVKALLQAFVALLEELQAGKAADAPTPEVDGTREERVEAEVLALVPEAPQSALPRQPGEDMAPPRFCASSAVKSLDRGERRGAQRRLAEVRPSGRNSGWRGWQFIRGKRWLPASGSEAGAGPAGMMDTNKRPARDGCALTPRARPPPDRLFPGGNSLGWA